MQLFQEIEPLLKGKIYQTLDLCLYISSNYDISLYQYKMKPPTSNLISPIWVHLRYQSRWITEVKHWSVSLTLWLFKLFEAWIILDLVWQASHCILPVNCLYTMTFIRKNSKSLELRAKHNHSIIVLLAMLSLDIWLAAKSWLIHTV